MDTKPQAKMIVAGKIYIKPGRRQDFISASVEAIMQARKISACLDFAVSADSIDAERVNIFELWESEQALLAFRGEGMAADHLTLIVRVEVSEYQI